MQPNTQFEVLKLREQVTKLEKRVATLEAGFLRAERIIVSLVGLLEKAKEARNAD